MSKHNIKDIKLGTKMVLIHYLYDSVSSEEIIISRDEEMLRKLLREMKECYTKAS